MHLSHEPDAKPWTGRSSRVLSVQGVIVTLPARLPNRNSHVFVEYRLNRTTFMFSRIGQLTPFRSSDPESSLSPYW